MDKTIGTYMKNNLHKVKQCNSVGTAMLFTKHTLTRQEKAELPLTANQKKVLQGFQIITDVDISSNFL